MTWDRATTLGMWARDSRVHPCRGVFHRGAGSKTMSGTGLGFGSLALIHICFIFVSSLIGETPRWTNGPEIWITIGVTRIVNIINASELVFSPMDEAALHSGAGQGCGLRSDSSESEHVTCRAPFLRIQTSTEDLFRSRGCKSTGCHTLPQEKLSCKYNPIPVTLFIPTLTVLPPSSLTFASPCPTSRRVKMPIFKSSNPPIESSSPHR